MIGRYGIFARELQAVCFFSSLFFSVVLATYFNAVAVGPANCPSLLSTTARYSSIAYALLSYLKCRSREKKKSTDDLRERWTHLHSCFIPSYLHPCRNLHFSNGREVLTVPTVPEKNRSRATS